MATKNRILTLDVGATGIKAAEFDLDSANNMTLVQFAAADYSEDLNENNRFIQVSQTLNRVLLEKQFTADRALLAISGQFTLSRFVKLPPVAEEEHRVRQIVEFEARQNVPFPIEEVVWDYQLIANPEADELEVMFVVIKNDIVKEITSAVQSAGLQPILVDVSSCASYNAARANRIGVDECSLVLDIGGRSTNLMFVDRNQFFTRTIPIAGITITQQIAKELGVSFEEAEDIKLKHGFVGLGGAYEDPASEVAASVSKIIRGVMTRLHGEINRSITLYRSQQKGVKPKRLYLAGGSSGMLYTDEFFAEKLGVEVEYLNPFKSIRISPQLDVEELGSKAYSFSQLVGLALRYRGPCPVEVNLLPKRIKAQVALNQKKLYLIGAISCILFLLVFSLIANVHRAQVYEPAIEKFEEQRGELEAMDRQISNAMSQVRDVEDQYYEFENLLRRREQWLDVVNQIERAAPDSLWVVQMRPIFEGHRAEMDDERRPETRRDPGASPFRTPEPRDRDFDDFDFDGDFYPDDMERPDREIVTEEDGPRGRIVGVEITGNSLTFPRVQREGAQVPAPTPPAFEQEDEPPQFPEPDVPPEIDEELLEGLPVEDDDGRGPEQVFLSRLKRLDIFSDRRTNFEDYQVSSEVLNLRSFAIRARFADAIDLEY